MADVPLDLIIAVGAQDEIRSLSSDLALTADSIGNRVIVSGQATAYRSIRTPPEASLVSGYGVGQITNGDSSIACLAFSSDWGALHAKVNAGGTFKAGYLGANSYAYYDKSSLAAQAHYDREDANTYNNISSGPTVVGAAVVCQVDTNLYFAVWDNGNGMAIQYDTTAGVWRNSAVAAAIHTANDINGHSGFNGSPNKYIKCTVTRVDATHVAVVGIYSGRVVVVGGDTGYAMVCCYVTIAPGSSPSAPTFTRTTSAGAGDLGSYVSYANGTYGAEASFAPLTSTIDAVMLDGTTIAIATPSYSNKTSGTYPTTTDLKSGIIKATLNTGTGAWSFSATYPWVTGTNRVGSRLAIAKIPGVAKAVISGRRDDQSNKVRGAVFSGSGYGTEVDIMTYTGITSTEECIQVICPDAARAVFFYKTDVDSTNVSGQKKTAAKTVSVTAGSNALSVDGTEFVLLDGLRCSALRPVLFDTGSFGICYYYVDTVVKAAGVTAETMETFTFSTITITRRSVMTPCRYIRQASTLGYMFPVDLGSNPKILAYLSDKNTAGTDYLFARVEEASGLIKQKSDGSVWGGYSRTA